MGKRSTFKRRERDFYPTPKSAVRPLMGHLPPTFSYWEPCAGNGALAQHIEDLAEGDITAYLTDIEPQADFIKQFDVFDIEAIFNGIDYFITNPPWPQKQGQPTTAIIDRLSFMRPTWMLLSSDFAHNGYFRALAPYCSKIVSVGRVSWMENGTAGKDNAAWYLFDQKHIGGTSFFPKQGKD